MIADAPRSDTALRAPRFGAVGPVALGLAVAVIGWWLVYVGGAWYSYETFVLFDGRNIVTPIAPRVLVLAVAAVSGMDTLALVGTWLAVASAWLLAHRRGDAEVVQPRRV